MCGILAIYSKNKTLKFSKKTITNALTKMNHRGPDKLSCTIDSGIVLGHVRLDIIDSDGGGQPFIKNKKELIFNGEIYNYLEIKEKIKKQTKFKSQSDTEVLFEVLNQYGEDGLKLLNGDWAFALYDRNEHTLIVSRDRFGAKPLYEYRTSEFTAYSSEIKVLLELFKDEIFPDLNTIQNYLLNSCGAEFKETWFKGVYRFPMSCFAKLSIDSSTISSYWDYPREIDDNIDLNQYPNLFDSAVRLRTRSDFPVTVALSSGIDSMSIAGKLIENKSISKAYTVGFENLVFQNEDLSQYRNLEVIDEVSLDKKYTNESNLELDVVGTTTFNYQSALESSIFAMECGHTSPAVAYLNQLYKQVRKEYRVVLDGQGADELLAGYTISFFIPWFFNCLVSLKFLTAYNGLIKFKNQYSIKLAIMKYFKTFHTFKEIYNILPMNRKLSRNFGKIKNLTPLRKKSKSFGWGKYIRDIHASTLANLIHYGDAISMNNSIESRSPFLDFRLVEYGMKLPIHFLFDGLVGKKIHRNYASSYLPEYIYNNNIKMGFNVPINEWFNSKNSWGSKILLDSITTNRGLFEENDILDLIQSNLKGKNDRKLYRVLSIEIWFRIFFKEWKK